MKFFKKPLMRGLGGAIALALILSFNATATNGPGKKDPLKKESPKTELAIKDPVKTYAGIDPVKLKKNKLTTTDGGSVHGIPINKQCNCGCCGAGTGNFVVNEGTGSHGTTIYTRQGDYAEKTGSGNYTTKGAGSHGTGGGYAEKSNVTLHSDMALLNGPPAIAKTNEDDEKGLKNDNDVIS